MDVKGWNIAVLAAIGALWFCGTTEREKPIVSGSSATARDKVSALEMRAAARPTDAGQLRDLAQAYLDIEQPGLAIGAIEHAATSVRADPLVEHVYARALLDEGRSIDALAAERRVLSNCVDASGEPTCSTWLFASATRRAEILQQLVDLGIEDAKAHPEASRVAYHNATREVTLAVYAR